MVKKNTLSTIALLHKQVYSAVYKCLQNDTHHCTCSSLQTKRYKIFFSSSILYFSGNRLPLIKMVGVAVMSASLHHWLI